MWHNKRPCCRFAVARCGHNVGFMVMGKVGAAFRTLCFVAGMGSTAALALKLVIAS